MVSTKNMSEMSQKTRRRCVIGSLTTSFAILIAWEILNQTNQPWELSVLIMTPLILIGFSFFAYLMSSRVVLLGDAHKTDFDERDKALFFKAHYIAFKYITLIGAQIIVFGLVIGYSEEYFVTDPLKYNRLTQLSGLTVMYLIGTAISLPTMIHAWLEPDPIPDNTILGGTT